MIFKCHGGTFKKVTEGRARYKHCNSAVREINIDDDWFILEYTSHSSTFLSQYNETRRDLCHYYRVTARPGCNYTYIHSDELPAPSTGHSG